MTAPEPAIYRGQVVHVRVRPRKHMLGYRVFSLLLDVDRIDDTTRSLRLFSRNRPNLFSFYDRDHGPGDGAPVGAHARAVLQQAGFDMEGARILLLAYPRILGAVFNPLSVYFAFDRMGELSALIYEVNNTVGERRSYVLAAGAPHGAVFAQTCAKELYVSPFTPRSGRYGFRVTRPGAELTIGVQLHDDEGALLRTHFRGEAAPLTDRTLSQLVWQYPLMTAKVAGAIHVEALRLWLKGVPVVQRHRSPRYSITIVRAAEEG